MSLWPACLPRSSGGRRASGDWARNNDGERGGWEARPSRLRPGFLIPSFGVSCLQRLPFVLKPDGSMDRDFHHTETFPANSAHFSFPTTQFQRRSREGPSLQQPASRGWNPGRLAQSVILTHGRAALSGMYLRERSSARPCDRAGGCDNVAGSANSGNKPG